MCTTREQREKMVLRSTMEAQLVKKIHNHNITNTNAITNTTNHGIISACL